jgi:hypothetical protein
MNSSRSARAGSLVTGVILIGLGVLFLLGQLFNFNAWRFLWPFTVIAFGALFFVGMVVGGRTAGALAIPGSIISMIGLTLLYQNLTRHWESWAYGWTLIVIAVGVGIFIMGLWSGEERHRQSGLRVAAVGFVLFVIFGSFFELGAALFGARGAGQLVFPLLLIGVGVYLLIARAGLWPARPAAPAVDNVPSGLTNVVEPPQGPEEPSQSQ